MSPIKKIMRGVGGKKVSEKETAADTLVAALKLPLKQPILKPILSKVLLFFHFTLIFLEISFCFVNVIYQENKY